MEFEGGNELRDEVKRLRLLLERTLFFLNDYTVQKERIVAELETK